MADKLIECPQCEMLVAWKGRHGSSVNLEIHLNDRGSVCTETWAVLSPEEIISDPLTLATECANCGHVYNWHDKAGR